MEHKIDTIHNQDKVFKEALELFIGKNLDFFGLEGILTEILSTEITETTTKKAYADNAFKTDDNKGLHFENEVDVSKDDIMRFCSYNIDLARKHKIAFTTIIVTLKSPKVGEYNEGSISFKPIIIDLSKRSADEVLESIEKGKVVSELELIYLPLYSSKNKTKEELFEKVISLVSKTENINRNKIFAFQILLMSTLVDREKLLNILEENMFKLENNPAIDFFVEKGVQRGIQKGVEQGIEEGVEKNKLETAVKMFKANFPLATISQILEMPIEWVENVVNRG